MPKLTQKQEKFCTEYLESQSATEAYRRSYNTKNMKPDTVHREAKALLDNPKIATRLDELRAPAIERAQITLDGHLAELAKLRDVAIELGNPSAAVAAEKARGQAAGYYSVKGSIDVKTNNEQPLIPGGLPELYAALHDRILMSKGD